MRFRPAVMMVLQTRVAGVVLAAYAGDGFARSRGLRQRTFTPEAEPDLIGFSIWANLSFAGIFYGVGADRLGRLGCAGACMLLEDRSAMARWFKA